MRNRTAVQRSRELRKQMTPFERKLWYSLNQRQIGGLKFRRQAAIGPYIVDFLSHEAKIVIEIDGDTHSESAAPYDARRTQCLEQSGFRVLRFWNVELAQNLSGVIDRIRSECDIAD